MAIVLITVAPTALQTVLRLLAFLLTGEKFSLLRNDAVLSALKRCFSDFLPRLLHFCAVFTKWKSWTSPEEPSRTLSRSSLYTI